MNNDKKIYIYLLDEGTDCWRPTIGINIKENIYKIEPTDDYDPENERWQFEPGSIVKCESKILSGKEILVAVGLANI